MVVPVKRLYAMRHAKSSWDDPALPDYLRPLAPRGEKAVRALARHMRATGIAPGLVLCSPATRALQTWEGVAVGLPAGTPFEVDDVLYGASAGDLMRQLGRLAADVDSVLVVGHNPGLEDLTLGLVGAGDPALRRRLEAKFATGALASLDVPGAWHDLRQGAATLVGFVVPRELQNPRSPALASAPPRSPTRMGLGLGTSHRDLRVDVSTRGRPPGLASRERRPLVLVTDTNRLVLRVAG